MKTKMPKNNAYNISRKYVVKIPIEKNNVKCDNQSNKSATEQEINKQTVKTNKMNNRKAKTYPPISSRGLKTSFLYTGRTGTVQSGMGHPAAGPVATEHAGTGQTGIEHIGLKPKDYHKVTGSKGKSVVHDTNEIPFGMTGYKVKQHEVCGILLVSTIPNFW